MTEGMKGLLSVLVVGLGLASASAGITNRQAWHIVNNGNYIDAGEPLKTDGAAYFVSLINDSGDLVYLFHSSHIGTVMGRLSTAQTWDLWSQGMWSDAPDTVATAISHATGSLSQMTLYNDPVTTNGLLGTAVQTMRGGTSNFDVHSFSGNFRFNGTEFRQWHSGATYDLLFNKSLIKT